MGADYYQTAQQVAQNEAEGITSMGIGKYCYIDKAILDKNCYIGNNVRIIGGKHHPDGDYDTHSIKDGIVVVKKNAVIPDGTNIM